MCSVRGGYVPLCAPLAPHGAIVLVHTHIHMYTTMCALAATQRLSFAKMQSGKLACKKIQAVTFIMRLQPKPSFPPSLEPKGMFVVELTFQLLSLSLTHSKGKDYVLLHTETLSGVALHGVNLYYLRLHLVRRL